MVSTSYLPLASFTLKKVLTFLLSSLPSLQPHTHFRFMHSWRKLISLKPYIMSSLLNPGQWRNIHYNSYWRACTVAQWVKLLEDKPDVMSSILRTHMMESTDSQKLSFDVHRGVHECGVWICMPPPTHKINVKKIKYHLTSLLYLKNGPGHLLPSSHTPQLSPFYLIFHGAVGTYSK